MLDEPNRQDQTEVADVLLLLLSELITNGLEHGTPPVTAEVRRTEQGWVLEVGDEAADVAPAPAVGRDPALGGMGLQLAARLSSAHGWFVRGDRKFVWTAVAAV